LTILAALDCSVYGSAANSQSNTDLITLHRRIQGLLAKPLPSVVLDANLKSGSVDQHQRTLTSVGLALLSAFAHTLSSFHSSRVGVVVGCSESLVEKRRYKYKDSQLVVGEIEVGGKERSSVRLRAS